MKIALVISEGVKQIMLTAETNHEKACLKIIQPDDKLKTVSKWGTFTGEKEIVGVSVDMAEGGYLRAYPDSESLMFVIEDQSLTNKGE